MHDVQTEADLQDEQLALHLLQVSSLDLNYPFGHDWTHLLSDNNNGETQLKHWLA